MTHAIIRTWDTDDGIRFIYRKNGKRMKGNKKFKSYFYVYWDDYEEMKPTIDGMAENVQEFIDKFDEVYAKITLKNNSFRWKLKEDLETEGIPTFEADVSASKRFIIDNPEFDLGQENLRIAYYDIETDDRRGFVKDSDGNILPVTPILSVAFKSRDTKKEYFIRNEGLDSEEFDEYRELIRKQIRKEDVSKELEEWKEKTDKALFKGERKLLKEFLKVMDDFDVLSAYNGSFFDELYIKERMKKHGLEKNMSTVIWHDYLLLFKKSNFDPIKSYSLDDLAKNYLKDNSMVKVDWKERTGLIRYFHMFLLEPEILKEYNLQDVILMDELEEKFQYFNISFKQCKITGCFLYDTLFNSRSLDIKYLSEYRKQEIVRPSKPSQDEIRKRSKRKVPGGFVLSNKGHYRYVVSIDAKSEYPCLQITYNISPETYRRTVMPDLTKVFNEKEIELIEFAIEQGLRFKSTSYKKKQYDKVINKKAEELGVDDMETLMWKFVREYDNKIDHKENETYTPADINFESGWKIYPHVVYDNSEEGIQPKVLKKLILERDKTKYQMKQHKDQPLVYKEKFDYQWALKILANSNYGVVALPAFRDYRYELGMSITTAARFQIKKGIVYGHDRGWKLAFTDTDSFNLKMPEGVTEEEVNIEYYYFYDEYIKPFNTKTEIELWNPKLKRKEKKNHFILFEYEQTYDHLIVVGKKRYYYRKGDEIGGKGGYQTRSDVLERGKRLQSMLIEDIFYDRYDSTVWKKFLKEEKKIIENYELEEKDLIKTKGLSKPVEDYGKPMIDGKTGEEKRKKDGNIMYSNVPENVKAAKKLIEEGENIIVGDKIPYIVFKDKPIEPITVNEYRRKKKEGIRELYDTEYYLTNIMKPVLEILFIVAPEDVVGKLRDVWGYSERKLKNLKKRLEEEADE